MLKFKKIIALCLTLFWAASSFAINSSELVGRWQSESELPNGLKTKTIITLAADGNFSGLSSVENQLVWKFGGTWKLDDNKLLWSYKESNITMPENSKTDEDEVDLVKLVDNLPLYRFVVPPLKLHRTYPEVC